MLYHVSLKYLGEVFERYQRSGLIYLYRKSGAMPMSGLVWVEASRVLVGIVWLLWYVVDVLSVCAQEHFGGDVGGVLGNLLMCRCVSLS